ncbi:MAG: TolC family protein, partial [Planctomycetota bacterium]|nr:TolC family protein [Planctomycetota bacterium]
MNWLSCMLLAVMAASCGCRSSKVDLRTTRPDTPVASRAEPSVDQAGGAAVTFNTAAAVSADGPVTNTSDVIQAAHFSTPPATNPPATPLLLNPAEMSVESRAAAPELLPSPPKPVTLGDVIAAVYASYPSLDAAAREQQITAGKQLSASGEFDQMLFGDVMTEPLGYYENYRYKLGLKQYQWNGTQSFAEYRLGRGSFEPWYLERQTNAGGEFKAGFLVPFVRDRDIDKRRAAVFLADLENSAARPIFQLEVIDAVRSASMAYWNWVAAGQRNQIAKQNLELAVDRQEGIEQRVAKGEIAAIDIVDNERLIVSRRAKLIEAERKLQQATIKLSLYLRDPTGTPLLVPADQVPGDFPQVTPPTLVLEDDQISTALSRRPELRLLNLEQQKQRVEVEQATNLTLPSLTGVFTASQDVGEPTSYKRDKSQAELEAGALLDVPLQRSEARGKLQTARGKLAQLAAKRRLMEQTIIAEVQSFRTALEASFAAVQQAERGAVLAQEMADAERKRLARGDSDIL